MLVHLTAKQAIDCLKNNEEIHVFNLATWGLTGCDMKREQIIKMIKTAEDIQIGGECCREMSHGLVLMPKDSKTIYDYYFVECDDNKLKEYDTDKVAIEEYKND